MSDLAIRVEGLGKRYRLGTRQRYRTLRDTVTGAFSRSARWAGALIQADHVPRNGASADETLWALRDVSFEVPRGEVVGIIGRNGAGKSTLLKILSRITEPTTGYADVYGRLGSLLEVGTGFHPELTGRENIYLNGAILGMMRAEIRRKFDEIVAFAEIERFLDTPVKHYSSGMYVRLAFAVAAHLEPEILLVDEVLAVGDTAFQRKCLGKMGDVARIGRTIVLVSHNIGSIKQLCTRGFLLDQGRIIQSGPINEVVSRYLMAEGGTDAATYTWTEAEAPGDETVKLRSMRLCDASGAGRSEFGSDESVHLEVEYAVCRPLQAFAVGCSLYAADGTYVFYSSDDDVSECAGQPRRPGRYASHCAIPASWLNVGQYFLVISAAVPLVRVVLGGLPRLWFRVIPTGGPTSRLSERRGGILCPALSWQVQELVAGRENDEQGTMTPTRYVATSAHEGRGSIASPA